MSLAIDPSKLEYESARFEPMPKPLVHRIWIRIPIAIVLLGLAYLLFQQGMNFRKWAWDYTASQGL